MNEPASPPQGPFGPVQVLLIGIEEPGAEEMISAELQDLANQKAIQIVDLMPVRRGLDGEVERLSSFEPINLPGRLVEALLFVDRTEESGTADAGRAGSRAAADTWFLAERIPPDSSAVVLLVEHRWAIPLREAAAEFEAEIFGDAWVHPRDLLAATRAARSLRP